MILFRRGPGPLLAWAAALLILAAALPALAAPTFPQLTGRVVDGANMLSPATEAELTRKLETLETRNRRQLVVVTLPSLQGYEIEDYGYQLGRAWGIGHKGENDGVLFIVAPNERKVRIEVGYGLEGILTDALSSVILQRVVLPKFRDGDMEGGVVAGTDALVQQLTLDDEAARERAALAAKEAAKSEGPPAWAIVIGLMVFSILLGMFSGPRRRRGGVFPIILGGGSGWGSGGGGWSSGGGGFSGGGGSFGGGGSSGGW